MPTELEILQNKVDILEKIIFGVYDKTKFKYDVCSGCSETTACNEYLLYYNNRLNIGPNPNDVITVEYYSYSITNSFCEVRLYDNCATLCPLCQKSLSKDYSTKKIHKNNKLVNEYISTQNGYIYIPK